MIEQFDFVVAGGREHLRHWWRSKVQHSGLAILLIGVLLSAVLPGCASSAPTPTPPPPAIQYEIGKGAEITQVSWSMNGGALAFLVIVKNTAATVQKFEVSINPDGEGYSVAGIEAAKEVKAGASQNYTMQASSLTPYPKTLKIRVVPE